MKDIQANNMAHASAETIKCEMFFKQPCLDVFQQNWVALSFSIKGA